MTAFVNERKLYVDGVRDEKQIDLLRMWLDAGCDLGNHTYSHLSLHDNDVAKFTGEIARGEVITKELLSAKDKKIQYFRHPYLATGLSMEIKVSRSTTYLDETRLHHRSGFNRYFRLGLLRCVRCRDNRRTTRNSKKKVGKAYVSYMDLKTAYWEKQSVRLFES